MLVDRARALRKEPTPAERRLWAMLRRQLLGHRFRRQEPIGPYIVDFVCYERRLVIEVDGGQHADPAYGDAARDAWLQRRGFRVLRFWNNEVMESPDGVHTLITEALRER